MAKILNDKYYTPTELASRLIETTFKVSAERTNEILVNQEGINNESNL